MAWLHCDDRPVAPLELAFYGAATSRGLMGRHDLDGALLLEPAHWIHTIGMHFALDIAFCDYDLRVVDVITVGPNRLCRPRLACSIVVEARSPAFRRWDLATGCRLRIDETG